MITCEYCGKKTPAISKHCIECGKPAKLDRKQQIIVIFDRGDGSYPTMTRRITEGASSSTSNEPNWKPAHLSMETLNTFMESQIDNFLAKGWELVVTCKHTHLFDWDTDEKTVYNSENIPVEEEVSYKGGSFTLRLTKLVTPEDVLEEDPYYIKAAEVDPKNFGLKKKFYNSSSPGSGIWWLLFIFGVILLIILYSNGLSN